VYIFLNNWRCNLSVSVDFSAVHISTLTISHYYFASPVRTHALIKLKCLHSRDQKCCPEGTKRVATPKSASFNPCPRDYWVCNQGSCAAGTGGFRGSWDAHSSPFANTRSSGRISLSGSLLAAPGTPESWKRWFVNTGKKVYRWKKYSIVWCYNIVIYVDK
jgi:hypothetical protein